MSEPLISVVMPVHNGLPFLSASIQSILDQTLTNFEFVILDDGSTDGTDRMLRDYQLKDSRVRICESKHRLGLAASSNFVVANSSASLIARMDADDICEPERLQRQWQVMRDNPRVGVVGTLCDGIDVNGKQVRSRDRSRIRRRSEFPPFPHGSAMLRRALFEEVGGYRRECEGREDQDLFRRMGARSQVVTLPEVLYHYRYHLQNFSVVNEAQSMSPHSLSSPEGLSSLYSLGAMRLWAGHSPSILRAIINDPSGKWTLQKLIVTTWAVWGSLHPNSLRSISRLVVRTRDLFAGVRVTDGRFYEWRYE